MTCCLAGTGLASEVSRATSVGPSAEELLLHSRALGNDLRQVDLNVPQVHCGVCIHTIESALGELDGVEHARVNLSAKRVTIRWRGDRLPPLVETLSRLGYTANLGDDRADEEDDALAELIRAVAVSGFAAGNIMLLSVSVWSGAQDSTRDLFHWVSALIAIPALAFAGRIFFRSAWSALRHGRMNMDVPIALGVSLAYGMSLYETVNHGPHAYFDASVSLLFFLLIGRTLDHVMRDRARVAVKGLARLAAHGAMILRRDGTREYVPVEEINPGMEVIVAAGERVPVDGLVLTGRSDIDCSLVTGESGPQRAEPGTVLRAGTLNLTAPLTIEAMADAQKSFLAEMLRLMEAVEGGRARYRRIADRASALYSPVVHLTALVTFLGWMAATGDWHRAVTIAIAVLIITCPCALGLAVPIVQVVAARRLFEHGIMVKDGSAMERLAEIDTALFDKTGTLTLGQPRLVNGDEIDAYNLCLAAAMAAHSRHPRSRAILAAAHGQKAAAECFDHVTEIAGLGVEAAAGDKLYRLGCAEWALGDAAAAGGTVLACNAELLARFSFEDGLRAGAEQALAELKDAGIVLEMISGDRNAIVEGLARRLLVDRFAARLLPADKVARLQALASDGHKVLMVGDGLNDVPALAAAQVSMAPASAADIGRNTADFVFLRENLRAVPLALAISRRANALIRQNFSLAIVYNALAVPIAIFGYVTPLIAAVAMSVSSLIVIANALRLHREPVLKTSCRRDLVREHRLEIAR
jgi:P-type Cu2+ transporter